MLKPRLIFYIALLLAFFTASAASAQSTLKLARIDQLESLLGEEYAFGLVTLSPDGARLAWGEPAQDAICVAVIADLNVQCYPWGENFRGFGRFSNLTWSPDGNTLVFTEDWAILAFDSDIWSLDLQSGVVTNRTDDNHYGGFFSVDEAITLDYAPVWNPLNNDLYFFRTEFNSANSADDRPFGLYLMPLSRTEPKLAQDFTAIFPPFSIYRAPIVSPDGTRMAVLVLPNDYRENPDAGVWIIDLKSRVAQQVADLSDFQNGLPEWQLDFPPLIPENITWVGNNALLVETVDRTGRAISQSATYIDLSTGTLSPIFDLTDLPDTATFFREDGTSDDPIHRMPRAGVVLPDNSAYLYLTFDSQRKAYIWSRPLPSDEGEPELLGQIEEFQFAPGAFDAPASISADGTRALMAGYLLTLEQS